MDMEKWSKLLGVTYERLDEPTNHGQRNGNCSLADVRIDDIPASRFFGEFCEWPSVESSRLPFGFYVAFMFQNGVHHPMDEGTLLDVMGARRPYVKIPGFVFDHISKQFGVPKTEFSLYYDLESDGLSYNRMQ